MRTLNLGILAHVDAGKTSLTERLLYSAGIIHELGSVDRGNTQTDSLALERQRGITIRSAVVSFVIPSADAGDPITVNLIDTPGHPDFIAEVERVLNVLDGAVLVLSAVEGVQPQTRVLMRTIRRLDIPTLLFVNKIDRGGARYGELLHDIAERLTPAIVAMGSLTDPGRPSAAFLSFGPGDLAFQAALGEALSECDETIFADLVDGRQRLSHRQLRSALAAHTQQARIHPVFFGSAITGAGVDALTKGIAEFLPATTDDAGGAVSGTVFKVERGLAGEKVAYLRMFSGTVRVRDRLSFGRGRESRVTAISVFENGASVPRSTVGPGQIAKLSGLGDVQIGDSVGVAPPAARHHFPPPTLESVIVPVRPGDRGALYAALSQLAEQDPLINLRTDGRGQDIVVSLYGEVQKQVIQATLANDFGIEVEFRETTTICIERPAGIGEALEVQHTAGNPFLATVGLRVEPAPVDSGVQFRMSSGALGRMPLAFVKAVEDSVRETLSQGIYGWQVTDCLVTMTRAGYSPRQSHAHQGFSKSRSSTGEDFRNLTPLVLMDALRSARTIVYEPMHSFRLELPADTFAAVLPALTRLRATSEVQETRGTAYVAEGEMPAANIHELQRLLPGLTRGEGVLESAFQRYQPVDGAPPTRPRSDHNPLNRKEYLMHVQRRV